MTFLIAMPVSQFLGGNLVSNLALLLGIPASRIKVRGRGQAAATSAALAL